MPPAPSATVSTSCLFAYPPQAAFDKVLPKNKIYAYAKPTRRLQQRFVTDVEKITWKYKLAPETIRLPARAGGGGVEEIQIFSVLLKPAAKAEKITEDILRCIDRAIRFPIIFEVAIDHQVRVVAAYKRPSEADGAKWVVGDYFLSPWLRADAPRAPLPVALDLASLYGQILRTLMPHPPRQAESLKDHAERLGRIRSLQSQLSKLEVRLRREKQFNLQVEINGQVRALQREIDELTAL